MMTREEAINILSESKRQNEVMRDNPSTFWASYQIADGIKNTKRRIDALDAALTALRPVSREQVEKVWKGCALCNWGGLDCVGIDSDGVYLSKPPEDERFRFCPVCGKPLTDEAVQMVMERLPD